VELERADALDGSNVEPEGRTDERKEKVADIPKEVFHSSLLDVRAGIFFCRRAKVIFYFENLAVQ
jgi:hypothetical protein